MTTDYSDQTVRLRDGRVLGFAEYGVPSGRAVFHFHGSGGSRLEHPLPEDLLSSLNIRFISVDRPGHGLSDFQAERRLLDWPDDVAQLANHLNSERFFVCGHSAGGPHALACAYALPERVCAGAAVSSVAPMSRPNAYDGLPFLNQLLARASRGFPAITRLIRRIMRRMVMADVEKASRQLMGSLPAADTAVLYAPENADLFVQTVQEGFRSGYQGVALDDILINQDWGFALADIAPRIDIWHGDADVNVPIHAAAYLRDSIPNTRTLILPAEGHFFILKRWHAILSALVDGAESPASRSC